MTVITKGSDGVTVRDLPTWPGWQFVVQLDLAAARPRLRELRVRPPSEHHLSAAEWRRLPIATVIRYATEGPTNDFIGLFAVDVQADEARPYGGSNSHHHKVARVYRLALSQGLSPRKVLSAAFKKSDKTIGRWIADARRAGALGTYNDERTLHAPPRQEGHEHDE